jgi:hypothetical protein
MQGREVSMDKPRHPQVIRPWKNQPQQNAKFRTLAKTDAPHAHEGKTKKPFGAKVPA